MNTHCGSWSFKWTLKFSESDCRGQNPSVWRVLYIIGKLLKRKCLKWARMTHVDIWNIRPKERSRVKLVVWLSTTKSQESTQFPCVKMAWDISLKSSQRGLQLCFRPHCNQRFAHKIMGLQNRKSPNFGSPWTKCHLDVGVAEKPIVYYKGEGVASPKSGPWWVLWVWVCSWLVLAPKMFKLCINQLVVWFM